MDSPDIDESPLPDESPESLVKRLSQSKCEQLCEKYKQALIIGSDQVAVLKGEILTKPGSYENGIQQLEKMRGETVSFLTGLCVFNTKNLNIYLDCIPYQVKFRQFNHEEICRYLEYEKPYDCAGSFKSEKSGVTLLDNMKGEDPTSLIGLPLIRLSQILRQEGVNLP